MIPSRWTLRRVGKFYVAIGAGAFLVAEVLERARYEARQQAIQQVDVHEWQNHPADLEDEEDDD